MLSFLSLFWSPPAPGGGLTAGIFRIVLRHALAVSGSAQEMLAQGLQAMDGAAFATDLEERVCSWQQSIEPHLDSQDRRPVFDINLYGLRIMDTLAAKVPSLFVVSQNNSLRCFFCSAGAAELSWWEAEAWRGQWPEACWQTPFSARGFSAFQELDVPHATLGPFYDQHCPRKR